MPTSASRRPALVTTVPPRTTRSKSAIRLLSSIEYPAPPLACGVGLFGCPDRFRELVAPLVRPSGVDDHSRVVRPLFGIDGRVERATPRTFDDAHVTLRITARHHCPQDVVSIRHVDVVINNDNQSATVCGGPDLSGDQPGLSRVPRVALLDADDDHQPIAALRCAPHARYARHASFR